MQHLNQQLRELTEQHDHAARTVAATADEVARATRVLRQAERTHARSVAHLDDLHTEIGTLRRAIFAARQPDHTGAP
jgi:chromosome segregation ATPase